MSTVSAGRVFVLIVFCSICLTNETPLFFRGRPRGGMLQPPAVSKDVILPKASYVEQRLNHFDAADTRTWKQRYWMNATFYQNIGPVFLMIGGEGTANPIWMVEGQWLKYAEKYQALCFMVEHRYYGESHPTDDLSVDNLQYLSSEQALADLAHFQQFITTKYSLTYDPRWILFAGSYPGSLSAWGRLKYPHLFHAAVSTSAPLEALLDFKQYVDVVVDSLETMSGTGKECTANIDKATKILESKITNVTARTGIKEKFSLCDDIENQDDIANFFSTMAGNFEGVVQYNRDNRAFEGATGTNITISTLCDIMCDNSIPDVVDRYATVSKTVMKAYGEACVSIQYKSMIEDLRQTDWKSSASEGGRQWTYQTCTEFGFFQSSDTNNPQPFGRNFPSDFFVQQCTDIFGAKFDENFLKSGIESTNTNYGGYNLNLSNIVYVNGKVDPWHALGFTEGNQAIFIEGTAHCANMYPDSPNDPPQLISAREKISGLLKPWIVE